MRTKDANTCKHQEETLATVTDADAQLTTVMKRPHGYSSPPQLGPDWPHQRHLPTPRQTA